MLPQRSCAGPEEVGEEIDGEEEMVDRKCVCRRLLLLFDSNVVRKDPVSAEVRSSVQLERVETSSGRRRERERKRSGVERRRVTA